MPIWGQGFHSKIQDLFLQNLDVMHGQVVAKNRYILKSSNLNTGSNEALPILCDLLGVGYGK